MVHTLPDYTSKWRSDTPTVNLNVSEIARRINPVSSPDGRGRMRWFDDMQGLEDGWYYQTVTSGAHSVTTEQPYTGDQAFRLETGVLLNSIQRMSKHLYPGDNPRQGVECIFANLLNDGSFVMEFSIQNGTESSLGSLRLDLKNDIIYFNPTWAGVFHNIAAHPFRPASLAYLTVKLVMDFETKMWVRAIVDGIEYDLSAWEATPVIAATGYRTLITLAAENIDAEVCRFNVGAVFLTDQEP